MSDRHDSNLTQPDPPPLDYASPIRSRRTVWQEVTQPFWHGNWIGMLSSWALFVLLGEVRLDCSLVLIVFPILILSALTTGGLAISLDTMKFRPSSRVIGSPTRAAKVGFLCGLSCNLILYALLANSVLALNPMLVTLWVFPFVQGVIASLFLKPQWAGGV